MHLFASSLTEYKRLPTKEVKVGDLLIGNFNPIRVQTMTTVDTMDTLGTVAEAIRCIEAGAELIRITAPSKKEAENLKHIKSELNRQGFHVPLVADIHFTPNAAEIAARLIEKVRINPGNYVDKKKFEQIDYSDAAYAEELDKIREKFTPLLKICKEYGTAMRIGTNHGSLSDRIMSRYGDTANGMVESAMEFLRIARDENFHNIVLSMKSSNPIVMVEAYRLLVQTMYQEFGEYYPLHLGVTEAGDGEDGRIKSAVGMGTLLEDGIGDTLRVSLTEAPELEIPVCKDLVKRYNFATNIHNNPIPELFQSPINTYTESIHNIGGDNVPIVIADFSSKIIESHTDLKSIGYNYDSNLDKWNIQDIAADYIYIGDQIIQFAIPGTLKPIQNSNIWLQNRDTQIFPIWSINEFDIEKAHDSLNFISISIDEDISKLQSLLKRNNIVWVLKSTKENSMQKMRNFAKDLRLLDSKQPIILNIESYWNHADEHLIHYSTEAGGVLMENLGNGILLSKQAYKSVHSNTDSVNTQVLTGRNYNNFESFEEFLNNTAFSILQATRKRITKTEYISCPSCGRTLFDLQETTAMIRKRTDHLKGIKIAIMGCIVNGPGEMADADFGYVGSGVGKITLYKGQNVVKRNIPSDIAVEELINLLKDNQVWTEPII